MTTIDTGGPALPLPELRDQFGNGLMEGCPGMSLRDWFAGQALAGSSTAAGYQGLPWPLVAKQAYAAADAMLAERAKAVRS